MDDKKQKAIIGNNRIEDIRWLCSLTDSELDLLIGLKSMVIQRAKRIGNLGLSKKFDLKMLRGLSFILMESLKCELKELETTPGSIEYTKFLERCNLSKCESDENFAGLGLEELVTFFCSQKKKVAEDMFREDMSPCKKQKTEAGGLDQEEDCSCD